MVPVQHRPDISANVRSARRTSIGESSMPRTYAAAVSQNTSSLDSSFCPPSAATSTASGLPPDSVEGAEPADINALAGPSSSSSLASPPASPISSRKGKGRAREAATKDGSRSAAGEIYYRPFRNEQEDMGDIMRLVQAELSEPYNIYTFRYFLLDWPHLAYLAYPSPESREAIGVIVCKQDSHRGRTNRGYIAMLSIDQAWRRRGIASRLVSLAIGAMKANNADEVVLETEYDNASSLALYERLGFFREKRLTRFYSNGKDAFRLVLPFPGHPYLLQETEEEAELGREMAGLAPESLYDTYRYPDDGTLPYQGYGGQLESGRGSPIPDVGRLRLDDWWDNGRPLPRLSGAAADNPTGRTEGWPVPPPPPPPIPPRQPSYYT